MKLVIISDTHCKHNQVTIPPCDVLIHCGDFSAMGREHETKKFLSWFAQQPAEHKLFIAGNHDLGFEDYPLLFRSFVPDNVIYLQDQEKVINGIKFYGTPWQPPFFSWGFNARDDSRQRYFDAISTDTQVLITHCSPKGILDFSNYQKKYVGCDILKKRIDQLPNLKLNVFGHIHEAYGKKKYNGITYVNASVCNENYKVTNKPIIILYN